MTFDPNKTGNNLPGILLAMKNTLELRPEDLPINVKLKSPDGTKEYVLVKTKQDRLLLNKPQEVPKQSRF
jgi:hypothetical protein